MTDREKKLMMLGQSVLNLLARDEIEFEDLVDRLFFNALDLGLADLVNNNEGVIKFTLTK
jgi:hypothetical protein